MSTKDYSAKQIMESQNDLALLKCLKERLEPSSSPKILFLSFFQIAVIGKTSICFQHILLNLFPVEVVRIAKANTKHIFYAKNRKLLGYSLGYNLKTCYLILLTKFCFCSHFFSLLIIVYRTRLSLSIVSIILLFPFNCFLYIKQAKAIRAFKSKFK